MKSDISPNPCVVGIDFGGTSVKIGFLSDILTDTTREPVILRTSDFKSVNALITAMARTVEGFKCYEEEIVAVGCGVPGLVDFDRGHVHTLTNVSGWNDIPLREILEDELGLPVLVDNDANCMTYAEYRYGAARGCSNVVGLTLGTGIGGGLIIGGKLYRGTRFAAGEIGQLSIDFQGQESPYGLRGVLEGYLGNLKICELASLRLKDRAVPEGGWTPKAVADLALDGDPVAIEIWVQIAEWLATALASIAWLLNPDVFVIGGGVANAGNLLFDPLQKKVLDRVSDVIAENLRILPAYFGNRAGIVGSAAQALDTVVQGPYVK